MQDAEVIPGAVQNQPYEILQIIFGFLPLFSQAKASGVNKSWYNVFYQRSLQINAKDAVSGIYDSNISPEKTRLGLSFFSPKLNFDVPEKDLGILSYRIIFCMLMENLNKITPEMLIQAESFNGDSRLRPVFLMMQYAKSDQAYKQDNRYDFEGYCVCNTCFVNFSGGNLVNEKMTQANFPASNFIKTNLNGAILDRANLGGANFSCASVNGTSFKGTNLHNADLTGISGTPIFDRYTILIGAKMSWCVERAAKQSGAIFTVSELKSRIRENPDAFPGMCPEKVEELFAQKQVTLSGIGRGSSSLYRQNNSTKLPAHASPSTPLMNDNVNNDRDCGCTLF